jgi:hypothetical protein
MRLTARGGKTMGENVPADLARILGPNEQVQLSIRQKLYHPKINIDSVAITNKRLILRHPHAMGLRKDYTDFNYQDISNVVLKKGILRSTIQCTLRFGGDPLTLDALPNSQAQKAYGIIRDNLVGFQTPFSAGYAGVPPREQVIAGDDNPGSACPRCGTALAAGQRFCGSCGVPVR